MIAPESVISTDWIQAINDGIDLAGPAVMDYGRREVRPFVSNLVDKTLRRPPGPVVYPIEWTSERQRAAFFATDGFGHGIPYVRTGTYEHGWHVRGEYGTDFGGIIVYNDAEYAIFVGGMYQQQFHRNTGWIYTPDALQVIVVETQGFVESGLPYVIAQAMEQAA